MWPLVVVAVVGTLGYFGWKLTFRNAYESASYSVVESDGPYQIREYPDLVLASTPMSRERRDDGSFMRLFQYISGRNIPEQKVAMTVPVFMERDEQSGASMGFVIPEEIALQGPPMPADERVEVRRRAAGRFAVVRFSGNADESTYEAREAALREWMVNRGLEGSDTSEAAGYDPPWTPAPFRRNEVLIRIES
jgi:hypothetical protein